MPNINRIKVIVQKRTTLKGLLTSLENLCNTEGFDRTNVQLRLTWVNEQMHEYQGLHI